MPSGIYESNKGRVAWNKGLKGIYKASEETRAKLREKRKGRKPGLGRKMPEEEKLRRREIALRLGMKPPNCKGMKHTAQAIANMSAGQRKSGYMQYAKGEMAPNWKGGIASKNHVARTSKAFIEWRKAVFARDNWTCQNCEAHGVHLHPHHIKGFAKYPELRFEVTNGLTLCKPCHLAHHGLTKKDAT